MLIFELIRLVEKKIRPFVISKGQPTLLSPVHIPVKRK